MGASKELTPKQHKFINEYLKCGNASEAYRRAYDVREGTAISTVNRAAKTLIDSPKIAAILEKHAQVAAQEAVCTIKTLLEELEQARNAALGAETPQSSAAVAATMGKAKLLGLDKQIVEMTAQVEQNLHVTSGLEEKIKALLDD